MVKDAKEKEKERKRKELKGSPKGAATKEYNSQINFIGRNHIMRINRFECVLLYCSARTG